MVSAAAGRLLTIRGFMGLQRCSKGGRSGSKLHLVQRTATSPPASDSGMRGFSHLRGPHVQAESFIFRLKAPTIIAPNEGNEFRVVRKPGRREPAAHYLRVGISRPHPCPHPAEHCERVPIVPARPSFNLLVKDGQSDRGGATGSDEKIEPLEFHGCRKRAEPSRSVAITVAQLRDFF